MLSGSQPRLILPPPPPTHLGTFGNVLVVTTQSGECYWDLVGKRLGCYQTVPHNKELLAPSVHSAEVKTCWELNLESFDHERMNSSEGIGGRKYGLQYEPNAILLLHEKKV